MAENITLARPYADAAFELAREANALGPWQEALDRMAAIAADPQMVACVDNPRLLPAQVAQLFLDVVGPASAEQQNFVRLLVDNERLQVLPEIRDLYVDLKNGQEGVQEADIASAFPLDEATLKHLVADLEARFKCRIKAEVSLEPELIGGVRIAVGDQVIDASVRGKLAAMATALQS
ncbi:MAG: F0F1 ATP synthase subunit delta [Zoogloeaceae bacterium]|jgi:F-type H+-transporting ATPase subunit delta|nr:F0F1 ATP synthase subunit delta [Zoogloeaceae bacterium]